MEVVFDSDGTITSEDESDIETQQEGEELVDFERIQKQKEDNGDIMTKYEQKQLPVASKLILETDPHTNNIIIEVDLRLVQYMKQHQIEGIQFLWNQVFKSTSQIAASINQETNEDRGGSGAILAHCMGLGKTFTTITLIHTLFCYTKLTYIHRALILCPLNTANNWKNEFQQWIGKLEPHINVYLFTADDIAKKDRLQFLCHWHENGGIMIMGYEMYRLLTNNASDAKVKTSRKKQKLTKYSDRKWKKKAMKTKVELADIKRYQKYLCSPGPDLIVCDEGHVLKNSKTAITRMVNQVRTLRRIVLTGTPVQNNLKEYYAMVNFCKPNYLGSKDDFDKNFREPIEAGQHKDSSPDSVAYMRRQAYILNQRLKTIIHRRDFDVLRSFLPPKFEYAVKIKCMPLQEELYRTYLSIQNINPTCRLNVAKLFSDYQYLMKIWTHPWLLKPHFIDGYYKKRKDQDQVETDQFFQDDSDDIEDDEEGSRTQKHAKQRSKNKFTQSITSSTSQSTISEYFLTSDDDDDSIVTDRMDEVMKAMKNEWWYDMFNVDRSQFDIEISGKFELFRVILNECESIGDKLLVFTRSLLTLDYIEQWLEHWSSRASSPKWIKGIDYFRVDGNVSIKQRSTYIKAFNEPENTQGRLFLISTMAGGVGINLYSANRVIIFDVSWNPAHDLQAMFRSYRLGQKKPVYVYRIIGKGTMEEKIYKRQITKQAMSQRVVDAKQLDRHFTYDELAQLYQFEPDIGNDPLDKYDADRIKDKVLRKLMDECKDLIVSYREHDSLLIHHDEENLTEEEQKQLQNEDKRSKSRLHDRNRAQSSTPSTDDSAIRNIPIPSQTQKSKTRLYPWEISKNLRLPATYDSSYHIPSRNISLESSKNPQSSTISSLTTGSKIQSTITPSLYINPITHIRTGLHNYKPNEIKSKLTSTKFNHLSGINNRPSLMSTEWCTTTDRNNQRHNNNDKFNTVNTSRMNLQSTDSFVQKRIATLASNSSSSFSSTTNTSKSTLTKPNASSKLTGNVLNNKEKSMLVISVFNKGLGQSITDTRQVKASPTTKAMNSTNSTFIIKKTSSPIQLIDLTKPTNANNDAKERAINILKQRLAEKHITPIKGQSLVSMDTTSSRKRLYTDSDSNLVSKRLKISNNNNNDSVDKKRFTDIMNKKSSYDDLYSPMTLDEIFECHKKKENIEEKLLHIMERDIKVVICQLCHYTAYKQSILCKQRQHSAKVYELKQNFFECIECHKRVFTSSQYPVAKCRNCHSSKGFRRTALIRKRHGVKFEDEILLLRSEEENFLNSFMSYEKLSSVIN
ncbi:unnamed protein product [Adineta steineri]|uniref:Transcriptional regulator ATRX n=1 Tax=Adineta steineri TaxID=433720 RepID=A0A815L008_9BILA|nr:unnamed protein product [Adineta steineri]CAF1402634.1 unnamed protein product [Adineta steineri]